MGPRKDAIKVEHYKRASVRLYDVATAPKDNEVLVNTAKKTQDYVQKGSRILDREGILHITGNGPSCSRVVTVAEVLKKKYKKPGLKQNTKIKYIKTEDIWEPTKEGLDVLKVVKQTPAISITLETPSKSS